jgi:hypothetical protein
LPRFATKKKKKRRRATRLSALRRKIETIFYQIKPPPLEARALFQESKNAPTEPLSSADALIKQISNFSNKTTRFLAPTAASQRQAPPNVDKRR